MLYKKKASLLNNHILHLTFSLVGSVDSGRETAVIPNRMAFQDLLCDLEVGTVLVSVVPIISTFIYTVGFGGEDAALG